MPLIYITGAPGSGKSTIQQALSENGIECYDIDEPQFGGPHNLESGERVVIPPAEERSSDWFNYHEWRIYHSAFEDLKQESKDKLVVICGVADADVEIIHIFDRIIYLSIDDETLKHRLLNRKNNDFGKNESELEIILRRKHRLDKQYNAENSVILNAVLPLDDAIKELLRILNSMMIS